MTRGRNWTAAEKKLPSGPMGKRLNCNVGQKAQPITGRRNAEGESHGAGSTPAE